MSVNYQVSVAFDCMVCFTCNHGQMVWDTLENVIQVNAPPPGQCWMLKGKIPFTHPAQVMDLNFDRGRWRRDLSLTLTSTVYSLLTLIGGDGEET